MRWQSSLRWDVEWRKCNRLWRKISPEEIMTIRPSSRCCEHQGRQRVIQTNSNRTLIVLQWRGECKEELYWQRSGNGFVPGRFHLRHPLGKALHCLKKLRPYLLRNLENGRNFCFRQMPRMLAAFFNILN